MNEIWKELIDFPGYAVSSFGRVTNTTTDVIKLQSLNQQGIPNVILMKRGKQYRRSVAVLVAEIFVTRPRQPHFNTPINLDGVRTNNRSDNLLWRPRWFAVKYHQQFSQPQRRGFNKPIIDMATGRQFETSWEAAIEFGLLDFEILTATLSRTYVFPTNQQFRVVDI